MTIQFPDNPENEQIWSPEDNPYNLIFQYDSPTNSWQIVGPDNLATVDYVDDKILETGSDVIRNYDLHTNVNTVSIVADYRLNSTTNRLATDSPNSLGEVYTCDEVFRDGLYGDTIVDQNPISLEESLAIQVPDWQKCLEKYTGSGEFEVVGYDEETTALSYKYRNIRSFLFNAQDRNYKPTDQSHSYDWLEQANVGDTLEVNFIVEGGGGDPRYAVYRILDIIEYVDYSPHRYGVQVQFLASATPDTEFSNNNDSTYYEFRNYLQPLNSSGGKLSGDLKIVSDSVSALSVWREDEDLDDRAFNVNTQTCELLSSRKLSELLTKDKHYSDPNTLVTVKFINERLGITDEDEVNGYLTRNNGPFLQIRGGTMTGTLKINRTQSGSGYNQFILMGKVNGNNDSKMLASYVDTNGDSIRYFGRIYHNNDIITKQHLDGKVTTLENNIDSKLDKNDSSSTNKMNVNLDMGSKHIKNLATPSDSQTKYGANVEYVKSKMSGKIQKGYTEEEGILYDINGVLYYNTY
jgi:hypothetical protein